MAHLEDSGGAATSLSPNADRVTDTIKRIHEYVWARHIDGSDHYDHSIDEQEATDLLDAHYSAISNRSSPDQVYLAVLLFERAFEMPDKQAEYFERARKIFQFYRRVTGEDDWPAVEDRLEDIEMFFKDDDEEEEEPAPAEAVAEAPVQPLALPVEEIPELAAAPESVEVAEPEVAEPETAEVAEVPQVASAAEAEELQKQEAAEARREAAAAFIADLEVVDGMQLVPAGTFIFGPNEKEVYLDSYYIDQVPVTNDAYTRFVRETGYRPPRYTDDARLNQDDQPVVGVGFNDAVQFAKWAGKELPTELQWEKAARGTDGRPYPWGYDPPGASDACFDLDPVGSAPVSVGQALRNVSPFGVQDVCGNIWEWTTSVFAKDSEYRVVRGGSYNDPAPMLALDYRQEAHPKDKCEAIGFRCVKNIHP